MADKTVKGRITQKHDNEQNWQKATGFIPNIAELIVYDPDENNLFSRIKIGDGKTVVSSLPFMNDIDSTSLNTMLEEVLV